MHVHNIERVILNIEVFSRATFTKDRDTYIMSLNSIPSCFPERWEVASLIFFGLVANYSLRLNLSIAIVEMTNRTNGNDSTVIAWTSEEKNYVLSAYFYGYVIMQVKKNVYLNRY